MRTPHRIVLLLLTLLPGIAAAGARWQAGGDFSLGHDSNYRNVPDGQEALASAVAEASVHLDGRYALAPGTGLLLRASLQGQDYARTPALANLRVGALAHLLWRPSPGLHAPLLGLSASAALWEFDSRMRDGGEYRAQLSLQQRLTTRVSMRLGAAASRREGDSAVFDVEGHSGTLDLDWRHGPLGLRLGYARGRGDVTATSMPGPVILGIAAAVEPDDAYDGALTNLRAYRFDGDTAMLSVGASYALSPDWTLDLQLRRVRVESAGGAARYDRGIASAGLLWRF